MNHFCKYFGWKATCSWLAFSRSSSPLVFMLGCLFHPCFVTVCLTRTFTLIGISTDWPVRQKVAFQRSAFFRVLQKHAMRQKVAGLLQVCETSVWRCDVVLDKLCKVWDTLLRARALHISMCYLSDTTMDAPHPHPEQLKVTPRRWGLWCFSSPGLSCSCTYCRPITVKFPLWLQ